MAKISLKSAVPAVKSYLEARKEPIELEASRSTIKTPYGNFTAWGRALISFERHLFLPASDDWEDREKRLALSYMLLGPLENDRVVFLDERGTEVINSFSPFLYGGRMRRFYLTIFLEYWKNGLNKLKNETFAIPAQLISQIINKATNSTIFLGRNNWQSLAECAIKICECPPNFAIDETVWVLSLYIAESLAYGKAVQFCPAPSPMWFFKTENGKWRLEIGQMVLDMLNSAEMLSHMMNIPDIVAYLRDREGSIVPYPFCNWFIWEGEGERYFPETIEDITELQGAQKFPLGEPIAILDVSLHQKIALIDSMSMVSADDYLPLKVFLKNINSIEKNNIRQNSTEIASDVSKNEEVEIERNKVRKFRLMDGDIPTDETKFSKSDLGRSALSFTSEFVALGISLVRGLRIAHLKRYVKTEALRSVRDTRQVLVAWYCSKCRQYMAATLSWGASKPFNLANWRSELLDCVQEYAYSFCRVCGHILQLKDIVAVLGAYYSPSVRRDLHWYYVRDRSGILKESWGYAEYPKLDFIPGQILHFDEIWNLDKVRDRLNSGHRFSDEEISEWELSLDSWPELWNRLGFKDIVEEVRDRLLDMASEDFSHCKLAVIDRQRGECSVRGDMIALEYGDGWAALDIDMFLRSGIARRLQPVDIVSWMVVSLYGIWQRSRDIVKHMRSKADDIELSIDYARGFIEYRWRDEKGGERSGRDDINDWKYGTDTPEQRACWLLRPLEVTKGKCACGERSHISQKVAPRAHWEKLDRTLMKKKFAFSAYPAQDKLFSCCVWRCPHHTLELTSEDWQKLSISSDEALRESYSSILEERNSYVVYRTRGERGLPLTFIGGEEAGGLISDFRRLALIYQSAGIAWPKRCRIWAITRDLLAVSSDLSEDKRCWSSAEREFWRACPGLYKGAERWECERLGEDSSPSGWADVYIVK